MLAFATLLSLSVLGAIAAPGKRGLGWPWDNKNNPAIFGTGRGAVSWAYNWESYGIDRLPKGMQYMSMARTREHGNPSLEANMARTGSKVLLCLNEPDNGGQANMSVDEAVAFYKKWCQPLRAKGIKVILPGITNGGAPSGFDYLDRFLAKCTGCKYDGINLHWYGDNLADLKAHIRKAISKYPKAKIYFTEFGLNNRTLPNSFLKGAMKFLDATKQVVSYAVFGAFDAKGGMISNGKLNAAGKLYVKR